MARSVFVLHGHRLCCDIVVVLIASLAIWILNISSETGDIQDLKYGVERIIDSGQTVQSVSRCLLLVKKAVPLLHDGMKKLQRWNH